MRKLLLTALLLVGQIGLSKTVGIWKDHRSAIRDGMLKTLQDAGWKTVILEGKDMSDETKFTDLDVIFLPGGWNAYFFANFDARRNLVKFTAGGKGVLAGAFRSGYVRTANRPLFPEVGATHNRVNGAYVWGYGDSELAKAISEPFCPGGWDHLVVKVGPKGKVFAVNGEDPVGVYGEVYGGRYLIFGAFIGIDAKTEPMKEPARSVLLKSLDWLASAPKLSNSKKAKQEAQADLDFLRREMLYDWTLNERGPDQGPGVEVEIRNGLAVPLESRLYTLQYMSQFLTGAKLKKCEAEAAVLKKAVEKLDKQHEKELANTKSRIEKMSLKELLAENPYVQGTNLISKVAAVTGKTEKEKKAMTASLRGRPTYASKDLAVYLHGDAIRERLMSKTELQKLVEQADKTVNGLKPLVTTAKAAKAAEERKQDLAMIPDLVKACSSDDTKTRREAVTELGRIGAPKTAGTLITMLQDPDEKVRIGAIIGLGWMQSKKAVPELIKAAQGRDMAMCRRAVQALGQIGDKRAIPVLVGALKNADYFVRENAILALGWLKAKAAVPELLKVVTGKEKPDAEQRGLMMAALRALGHIGDPSALPTLEKLTQESKDFPLTRRRKKLSNIYSTSQNLGLQGCAELAIEEIKAGGRKEVGVKQADFLAAGDKFYGLTRRFNALAGRSFLLFNPHFKDDPKQLFPYLWEAGMTGIHQAWGSQGYDPEKYVELVKAAGEFDLLWIDVMPSDIQPYGRTFYDDHRQSALEKTGAEIVLMEYQDVPAFHGFWYEEQYPEVKATPAEFEAWLKDKYGPGFRKKLGVAKDADLLGMTGKGYADYNGPLKTEYTQFCGEKLLAYWRESQEWMRGMRKGCAFTFSVSTVVAMKYPGVAGKAGAIIDVNGPEEYQAFGRYNAFFMEMHKDGEARPVMCEFYNWYGPSSAQDVRGFAQHLMHGECFYNFCLNHIFGQASRYDMWSWEASRWADMKKMFQKARKTGDYLTVPESAANVGVVVSELSFVPFYVRGINDSNNSLLQRGYQEQAGLWTALNQSQIPTDILMAETLTAEKLKRYRVLVLSDAKIVTEEQAKLLRDWVNAGGTLIASGTTSLFDQWAVQRKDYLLSDMFGLNHVDHVGVSDPNKIDTYCWKPGGETTFKAVSGLDPENFRNHVHRDFKPVKSIGTYTVCEKPEEYLPGIDSAMPVEYDMPLGYDKVKPISAEVLAKFANGDPALTLNKVGKGLCYFWTPIYPGLCYVASEWEMQPNRFEFWPNVRELLDAMVKGGLDHQAAMLPVEVSNVSEEIEVTVRQQPEHNRWMIHLLNYDPKVDLVKSPSLLVHPPEGRTLKRIFYPDTDTNVKFKTGERGVEAKMRDFNVHDMLVVEYE